VRKDQLNDKLLKVYFLGIINSIIIVRISLSCKYIIRRSLYMDITTYKRVPIVHSNKCGVIGNSY
jgi:hypothetical protein